MDTNERKVLEMLSEGKITAAEAEALLDKVGKAESKPASGEAPPKAESKPASGEAPPKAGGQENGPARGPRINVNVGGGLLGNLGSMIEQTTASIIENATSHVDGVVDAVKDKGWGVDVKVGGEAPSQAGEKPAPGASSSSFSGAFGFATPGKTRVWSATSGGDASARATGGGATARATGGRVSSQSSGTNVSTHSGDDMVEGARTVHVPQVPGAALRVRSRNGSVSVRPGGGEEAVIEAVIRAENEERLNDTRISVERLADETLVVEPVWPEGGPRPNEGCRFEVAIDQIRGMEIQTTNGAIEVEGMAGNAELDTENGAITVRSHAGTVRATSSNGAITVEGAGGAVVARTASARIDIEAEGPVEARTSNGAVSAVLGPNNEGPVDVVTSNGAISLDLGGAFRGDLKLKTSNANIDFNQPGNVQVVKSSPTSARLQAGEGGSASSAKTSNAGVRVRFTG